MTKRRKTRLKHLAEKVQKGERIGGMECHDTPSAIMAEELGLDLLCCGSPGPMGMMGHPSMATVDFEEQLYMLEGVLRGAQSPFIICNMPNTTACISIEESVRNAAIVELVKASIDAGIFAALFEHTTVELTKWCYENLPVAVASLGSGPHAHGIFHVSSDIIGCSVFPIPPKREVFGDVWGEMQRLKSQT